MTEGMNQRRRGGGKGVCSSVPKDGHEIHSVMQLEGHSSMQAPQSTHLPASTIAMSSTVRAPSGLRRDGGPRGNRVASAESADKAGGGLHHR